MLHELLLALSGFSGSLFTRDHHGKFKVANNLPFLHPSEKCILNQICSVATYYSQFMEFIQSHTLCPALKTEGAVGRHGLYIKSFADGLGLVLNAYRKRLLDLEQELLTGEHLTITYIEASLRKYQVLFPALASVLNQISQHKEHGCNILEVLYKNSYNGTPIVRQSLLSILEVCHGVMYKQLSGWLLHGMLIDQYNEFFVQKLAQTVPDAEENSCAEDELSLSSVSSMQIQNLLKLTNEGMGKKVQFLLRVELLPSYIPLRVAEKILFVGESIQVFESKKQNHMYNQQGSIIKDREDEFAKELMQLSKLPEFNLMLFEGVVDKIRVFVAEQLWKLVVEEAELVTELQVIKDFFLLGRGELFLAFIDNVQNLLKVPPTGSTQHDINRSFEQAARNVLLEDEKVLQHFKFIINAPISSKQKGPEHKQGKKISGAPPLKVENGWSVLNLSYKVDWPLHILFTPGVLERYNTLFCFLLRLKKTQLELQQCWAFQMRCRKKQTLEEQNRWWLRNHMAFLIDNLQYYLQVDVIDSQFTQLRERIQNTRDFEEVHFAHEKFLASLLAQSFLLMKPISQCFSSILDLCHQFCILEMGESEFSSQDQWHLDKITSSFKRQSNLLFKILSNEKNHQTSPYLCQLLLRIDFNKYFSSSGGQLGSIQISKPSATIFASTIRN